MSNLIEQKLRNFPSLYVTDSELAVTLNVSDSRRYSLVKRALKRGDLVQIRRGLYTIGENLTPKKPHACELAQKIYWPSYISLESALAFHGLIPEAVYNITSVSTNRSTTFTTPLGTFIYRKIPPINFFIQVEKKMENNSSFLVATPWKAICDYIYCYKKNWSDITPLVESLRIEPEDLPRIFSGDVDELEKFYNLKRMRNFFNYLKKHFTA